MSREGAFLANNLLFVAFALIVFSVFENVGMNMGIMPVAGIPLPFLSYGGSSMICFFAAIGIVSSVHARSVR